MKKNYKIAISGLMLLLLAVSAHCLPKAMLLYSGYCFEEERYLTTQEKFDIVVTKIISEADWRLPYTINEFGAKVFPEEPIRTFQYSSLEEFNALNPNCCELVEVLKSGDRLQATIPFDERLCGRINILVRVFYIYDYDAQNNNQPLYAEKYFGLSNCGKLWTASEVIDFFDGPGW